jgi:signal transduction histidine kinase
MTIIGPEMDVITGLSAKTDGYKKKIPLGNSSALKKKKVIPAEKVIIVEKDQSIRTSIARVLLKMQYRVDCFKDFGEAIANSQGVKARLVIVSIYQTELLDMIMAQFSPDTGILIITDVQNLPAAAQSKCCAIRSFLIRPFTARQLSESVLQTLDGVSQISESLKSSALAEIDDKQVFWPKSGDSFHQLLQMLTVRTDAVYASVMLKDVGTRLYSVRAEKGVARPSWKSLCERIATTVDTAAVYSRSNASLETAQLMSESSIECILCAPLIVRGQMRGIINLIKTEAGTSFKPGDVAFTSLLARQFGMGLENTALSEDVRTQQSYVQKLLTEISQAQTNERRRVATEIHDGVAQWLVGAALDISACHQLIGCNQFDDLGDSLLRVKETLQNSIRELRRAIADLRPELLIRLGLVDAITQSIEVLKQAGIECDLKIEGPAPKFSAAVESNVYWIVQEMLSNIRKHAEARYVSVCLQSLGGMFSIIVEDDGRGFDSNAVMNSNLTLEHVGIMGMKERAELLGADLILMSTPGKGTTGCLKLPVVLQNFEGESNGKNCKPKN